MAAGARSAAAVNRPEAGGGDRRGAYVPRRTSPRQVVARGKRPARGGRLRRRRHRRWAGARVRSTDGCRFGVDVRSMLVLRAVRVAVSWTVVPSCKPPCRRQPAAASGHRRRPGRAPHGVRFTRARVHRVHRDTRACRQATRARTRAASSAVPVSGRRPGIVRRAGLRSPPARRHRAGDARACGVAEGDGRDRPRKAGPFAPAHRHLRPRAAAH